MWQFLSFFMVLILMIYMLGCINVSYMKLKSPYVNFISFNFCHNFYFIQFLLFSCLFGLGVLGLVFICNHLSFHPSAICSVWLFGWGICLLRPGVFLCFLFVWLGCGKTFVHFALVELFDVAIHLVPNWAVFI